MNTLKYKNNKYILADVLLTEAPIYSKTCRSSRDIIKKKKIGEEDYIYAKQKDSKWIITDGSSAKFDKVFIKESIIKSIPEMNKEVEPKEEDIQMAPEIIHLREEEKFKDEKGETLEIETRGERKVDKIYFKVKDVSSEFEMDNLLTTIIDKRYNGYCDGIHYKYFMCKKIEDPKNNTTKISKVSKELYLTYEGILRVLFGSNSPKIKKFIKWATETIFTIQMGTDEQKQTLCGNLMGINVQVIKDVFNSKSNKTPCVYLIYLGKAKDLLKNNSYSEEDMVCKYGCTDDLAERISQHERNYKRMFNTNISLLLYSIIESKYKFEAESNIRQYFKGNKLDYQNTNELIVINKKELDSITTYYKMVQNSYIGKYEELNNKIQDLEKKVLDLNNQLIIKDKDILMKNREIEMIIETKDKDIIIEKQKNELLELKLQISIMNQHNHK